MVDLGCGIGGDLISAARAGLRVTGVERDPATAAAARANLAALDLPGEVLVGDAEAPTSRRTRWCSPTRRGERTGGECSTTTRTRRPGRFITGLLERTACVKVAPGIPHDAVPDGVEAEWISDAGEVKEAALWSGKLYAGTTRRATLLPGGATVTARTGDRERPGRPVHLRAGRSRRPGRSGHGRRRCGRRMVAGSADRLRDRGQARADAARFGVRDRRGAALQGESAAVLGTHRGHRHARDQEARRRPRPRRTPQEAGPQGHGVGHPIVTRIGRDAVAYSCRRIDLRSTLYSNI